MNQLVNKTEIKKLVDPKNSDKSLSLKELMQESYQNILDIMEQRHQKLFEMVKKKIGMQR